MPHTSGARAGRAAARSAWIGGRGRGVRRWPNNYYYGNGGGTVVVGDPWGYGYGYGGYGLWDGFNFPVINERLPFVSVVQQPVAQPTVPTPPAIPAAPTPPVKSRLSGGEIAGISIAALALAGVVVIASRRRY